MTHDKMTSGALADNSVSLRKTLRSDLSPPLSGQIACIYSMFHNETKHLEEKG